MQLDHACCLVLACSEAGQQEAAPVQVVEFLLADEVVGVVLRVALLAVRIQLLIQVVPVRLAAIDMIVPDLLLLLVQQHVTVSLPHLISPSSRGIFPFCSLKPS